MKKFSTLEKVLIAFPLVVFCGLGPQALRAEKLSSTVQSLAGSGAQDCSCSAIATSNKKKRAMKDCAANAFKTKHPFWMCDLQESGGQEANGWALARDGRFFAVRQTRMGWLNRPRLDIARVDGVDFRSFSAGQPPEIIYKRKVFLE